MKILRWSLIAAAIVACGSSALQADDAYPTRPVRLIVGFPPGGPTDVIGRVIAKGLTDQLGKQVLVDNLGGAGGTTGAAKCRESGARRLHAPC